MFGNLISEQFSKLLNLKIVGSQRTTGTAAKGGSITILGKTASPVRLYLENVNRVVTFTPYVVKDLAHPLLTLMKIQPHSMKLLIKPSTFYPNTKVRIQFMNAYI